jgi:hypothetical protein
MGDILMFLLTLSPVHLLGSSAAEQAGCPLPSATWYTAQSVGDGLEYRFDRGALNGARFLAADMLVDGHELAVFELVLQEGHGPSFSMRLGALNQCAARLRIPAGAATQGRWRYAREGAWLKPTCGGQSVDLRKVDRMSITVACKSEQPVRWCLTPITATVEKPPKLE